MKIVGKFNMLPTITNTNQQVLISDLDLITEHVNLSYLPSVLTANNQASANEVWISYKNVPPDPEGFSEGLAESTLSPKPLVLETQSELSQANLDPLIDAGWQSLLFYSLGVVLVLTTIGFIFHSYISFKNRSWELIN